MDASGISIPDAGWRGSPSRGWITGFFWDVWRRDAGAVLDEAGALREAIPKPDLTAHLGAAGAGADAIGENAAKIGNRIREDEQERALAAEQAHRARIAARHRQAVEEAERLRLEEERGPERNQGGGMSMS